MNGIQNVKDFGAVGDGTTDDSGAIMKAYKSVPSPGGSIIFPPGTYAVTGQSLVIPSYVQVIFAEGAMLAPSGGCTVTINGHVTAHPMQHIFDGTGYNGPLSGAGTLGVSGDPLGNFFFVVTITNDGPPTHFTYSLNNGASCTPVVLAPGDLTYVVPGTGVTLTFTNQTYSKGDSWSWKSSAAVTLSSMAAAEFSVKWWGAVGDGKTADDHAIQRAIWAAAAPFVAVGSPPAGSTSVFLPPGVYRTKNSLLLPGCVSIRGSSRAAYKDPSLSILNNGTTIMVDHTGIGIVHSNGLVLIPNPQPPPKNNPWAGFGCAVIRDLTLSGSVHRVPERPLHEIEFVDVTTLAGIQFLCVNYSTIQDCNITGFQFGIVLDGAEVCSVQRCMMSNDPTIEKSYTRGGLYLTNGPTFNVNQVPGTTNVISIRDCQFNGGEVGLIDDGGGMLEISSCNFNAQSCYSIYMAGRACARVTTSDFESAPVHFDDKAYLPSLQTDQPYANGQSTAIMFSECSSLQIDIASLGTLDLYRNLMGVNKTTGFSVTGGQYAASITCHNNTPFKIDKPPTNGGLDVSGHPYNCQIRAGTKPPTPDPVAGSGYAFNVGDIVWNTAPSPGGYMGWVCTTAGRPPVDSQRVKLPGQAKSLPITKDEPGVPPIWNAFGEISK
jgi:hypothetical protein